MTELSFNEQSHQVSNDTQTQDVAESNCEDDATEYERQSGEKHVTIDEELPVVYKPKSFSVPDLLDETYVNSKHQHPALKFSTSNVGTDIKLFKKWFPKEKQATCYSPFTQRKNKRKDTENTELSRQRGKTFPQYSDDEVDEVKCDHRVSETKNRSHSTNSYDTKWMSFWKKINLFPKLTRMKPRRKTKNQTGSFHDLPPIRCSASMADIMADTETNNNAMIMKKSDSEEHYFHVTKSYKPVLQSLKHEPCKCETVKLKRIKSLPIL